MVLPSPGRPTIRYKVAIAVRVELMPSRVPSRAVEERLREVPQRACMYLDLAVYEPDPGSVTGAAAAEPMWPLG